MVPMSTKIYKNLIGGRWLEAKAGKTFLNHNPANVGEIVGESSTPRESLSTWTIRTV